MSSRSLIPLQTGAMLILVPTAYEQAIIADELGPALLESHQLELVGFGPVAAAARTAALLAAARPAAVLLVGIAGSLDHQLDVGGAAWFQRVACHGVGVGTGRAFLPAGQLGWPQWPGDTATGGAVIGDELELAGMLAAGQPADQLLSAAAASASPDDVAVRRQLFPDAVAEDMEGFAVAAACQLAGVPCRIIRGISNRAGDRNKANWLIELALQAAAELARDLLEEAA